jgi:hypothetical protein
MRLKDHVARSLNKDRHRWSATCNRVAASKLLEDFTNFRCWREAESSIRIQEGPPNKSVPYQILFSGHPLEAPYLRQTLSCLGRTQTSAALPVRRGLPLSIEDSAGSSHETAGLEDLCAKRSGKGSWPDRLSWHDSDNHRAWFRPKDRPGWEPLQGPMAVGLRSPADF